MPLSETPPPNTPPPVRIHLISHNHWDREWIFTARFANRWLIKFFRNLFRRLHRQPAYRFVLDGQTRIIEDYLDQLPPEEAAARERDIRRLVRAGRLLIGPAYLQPDWSLVSGEALVRNLLIGDRICRHYGAAMKAGWLLDNFGQIAQAPQILAGFGIKGAFVWRGVEMPPDNIRTEFWWESPDGSRILGVYLLDSYRNAMVLGMTPEIAEERIAFHTRTLLRFASTPNVLLMNGYEQVPEPDDVLPIISQANKRLEPRFTCVQSTPPDYLESISTCRPELPVLGGYMYSGRYSPILKGVFSSRSHLIQQNNACQRELERWAEAFNALAWVFGSDYPAEVFDTAWKTLLLNHTHDDMCGCCIDPIARDMQRRFKAVDRMARVLSSDSLCAIAQSIDTSDISTPALVIFNPSLRPRSEVVDLTMELDEEMAQFHLQDREGAVIPVQIASRIGRKVSLFCWASDIPAMGYKTLHVMDGPASREPACPGVWAHADDRTMENDRLVVRINADGTYGLFDKKRDRWYDPLGYFEDGGDCGDTYDYSYPETDAVITSRNRDAAITLETAGPLIARYRIEIRLPLPVALTRDRRRRSARIRRVPIVSHVELRAGSKRIGVRTVVDNVVKDHRLRVLFPTKIRTDTAHSGMPFDTAAFPLDGIPQTEAPSADVKDLMLAGHYTAAVDTQPFQRFVTLVAPDNGITILSRDLSEYEVERNDAAIALTLIRGVGWLARPDLLTRVGDVGPHIFTPEAQCLGRQSFDYAIYPHNGDLLKANPAFEADCHMLPFRVVQIPPKSGNLPKELSFIGVQTESPKGALKLSCVKRAEAGDGIIARVVNDTDSPARGALKLGCMVLKAWRTDLNETPLHALPVHDNTLRISVKSKEIATFKVRPSPAQILDGNHAGAARVLYSPQPQPPAATADPPPLLTAREVAAEFARVDNLQKKRDKIEAKIQALSGSGPDDDPKYSGQMKALHALEGRKATLLRQYHEARISALLNKQLLTTHRIEDSLGEIGDALNWARVQKRVGEFLIHYHSGRPTAGAAGGVDPA